MKVVSSLLPPEYLQREVKTEFPEVEFEFFKGIAAAETSLKEAEVFITYGENLTENHIKSARNLKWIMVMSAGLDKMPFAACKERSLLVTNVRGIHKTPMAEFTLGMMLQHTKQIKALWKQEEREEWNRKIPVGELYKKTILILGVGAIGGEIARLAKAFNMNTIGVNRSGGKVDFIDEVFTQEEFGKILPRADFIVSVLPSTDETKHLLTAEHFEKMKESAVFINIGRGDLVEEHILLDALQSNQIAHAYLDVFYNEPLRDGHPFWEMDNVTVTPHISSITRNYLPRAFDIFKHNLHTYNKNSDKYLNVINLERGY